MAGPFTRSRMVEAGASKPAAGSGRRGFVAAKTVGSFVPQLTRKAFEKYGFSTAALITDWTAIAGPQLAAYTAPEKLKWPRAVEGYGEVEPGAQGRPGATLILRVDGGCALDVEYRRRELIERINSYFGYRAIAELRILQAPVAVSSTPRAVLQPRTVVPRGVIAPEIAGIPNEGLREALARMEQGIAAAKAARMARPGR